MTTASTPELQPMVSVDRVKLIRAVKRAHLVAPTKSPKHILTCVHLQTIEGFLQLRATDLETSAFAHVPAEGSLPPCVLPCAELLARLKASKSPSLMLWTHDGQLMLNGGSVKHSLQTMNKDDYPIVTSQLMGKTIELDAKELCRALSTASLAAARESARYAIDGILLECDDKGTRLVATDGRRMVVIELGSTAGDFEGQAIMPRHMSELIVKFTEKNTDFLVLAVHRGKAEDGKSLTTTLYAAGPDWLLSTQEEEGHFPLYRNVLPPSASRFAVNRTAFIETLSAVAASTSQDSQAVRLSLSQKQLELASRCPESGASSASIECDFLGGNDLVIHTAFNPAFLLDALNTLPSEEVVVDIAQNAPAGSQAQGRPALLYSRNDQSVRWVVMPVNIGLAATAENLGSNYAIQENEGEAA